MKALFHKDLPDVTPPGPAPATLEMTFALMIPNGGQSSSYHIHIPGFGVEKNSKGSALTIFKIIYSMWINVLPACIYVCMCTYVRLCTGN